MNWTSLFVDASVVVVVFILIVRVIIRRGRIKKIDFNREIIVKDEIITEVQGVESTVNPEKTEGVEKDQIQTSERLRINDKFQILIVEDNPQHLNDAKKIAAGYGGIEFTFASDLQEAKCLLQQYIFDAAVSDIFFPLQKDGESTSDSAVEIAVLLNDNKIPFVYNTSGNHHDRPYEEFRKNLRVKSKAPDGFGSGKIIESYEGESAGKQWMASISYAILLGNTFSLTEEIKEWANELLNFSSYGDYGKLTEIVFRVIDSSIAPEEIARRKHYAPFELRERKLYAWNEIAFYKIQNELGLSNGDSYEWDKEKNTFISSRDSKVADEALYVEIEIKCKADYLEAVNFIRTTLERFTD